MNVSWKLEETPSDVPEVHIKDLLARAEMPDHIEDLLAGFLQHLRNRALAEIQAVIRTIDDVDKALQAIHRSEDRLDAPEPSSFRHTGILRMTGQPHLEFLGDRHDAMKEVRNPLPIRISANNTSGRERRQWPRFVIHEGAVSRIATSLRRFSADNAEEAEIVF